MRKFLFANRVPKDYQPGGQSRQAWEAWFESLCSSRVGGVEIGAVPDLTDNPRAGTSA